MWIDNLYHIKPGKYHGVGTLMQHSVNIAAEWTNNNDMKINSEKSKEIIISYAHGNIGNEVPNILMYGKVVERVDHVKLLGITLSHGLTWKSMWTTL